MRGTEFKGKTTTGHSGDAEMLENARLHRMERQRDLVGHATLDSLRCGAYSLMVGYPVYSV